GDWELAATVLSSGWLELLVRGEAAAMADLIERFPLRMVTREPELAIAAGGSLLECGELEQGLEYVALADHNAAAVKPNRRADLTGRHRTRPATRWAAAAGRRSRAVCVGDLRVPPQPVVRCRRVPGRRRRGSTEVARPPRVDRRRLHPGARGAAIRRRGTGAT